MTTPEQDSSNEEHRKYPRLKKDVTVKFKLANSPDTYLEAFSEDISQVGIKLELVAPNQRFSKGNIMELALQGSPAAETIKVLGQVVWVDQRRFSFDVKMGIKILAVLEGSEEGFKKLLSARSK